MAIFYTSDLHLGHENILPSRPQFNSIEMHDEFLIERWNSVVKNNDEIFILGDLSYRAKYHVSHYLNRMRGKKKLIVGNHDSYWMKNVEDLSVYFESVDYFKTIKWEHKLLTMMHFPMLEWTESRRIDDYSYLIHGHTHREKNATYEYIKDNLPHALNASVDVNNFRPVVFEELKKNNAVFYEREI